MKHNNILITAVVAALLFAACGGQDFSPKPQAYLRIDLPEHSYIKVDTASLPFTFDVASGVQLDIKRHTPREIWVDLLYPQLNGVVFLSYKHLSGPDDLRGQTDTSSRLLESHYQFASGIEEQSYNDTINHVYGTTYHLRGNRVATTYQFWATDREQHFLRGVLYVNATPNNDSLAPVLEYMQDDLDHLIESLRWRR